MNAQNGNLSAGTSFILGAITWFSHMDIEFAIRVLVGIGSIITAFMAVRYYYFAIVEKKKILATLALKALNNARHIKANTHELDAHTSRIEELEKKN